jgi:hypothetical protein
MNYHPAQPSAGISVELGVIFGDIGDFLQHEDRLKTCGVVRFGIDLTQDRRSIFPALAEDATPYDRAARESKVENYDQRCSALGLMLYNSLNSDLRGRLKAHASWSESIRDSFDPFLIWDLIKTFIFCPEFGKFSALRETEATLAELRPGTANLADYIETWERQSTLVARIRTKLFPNALAGTTEGKTEAEIALLFLQSLGERFAVIQNSRNLSDLTMAVATHAVRQMVATNPGLTSSFVIVAAAVNPPPLMTACFLFARANTCKFGTKCKFSHEPQMCANHLEMERLAHRRAGQERHDDKRSRQDDPQQHKPAQPTLYTMQTPIGPQLVAAQVLPSGETQLYPVQGGAAQVFPGHLPPENSLQMVAMQPPAVGGPCSYCLSRNLPGFNLHTLGNCPRG